MFHTIQKKIKKSTQSAIETQNWLFKVFSIIHYAFIISHNVVVAAQSLQYPYIELNKCAAQKFSSVIFVRRRGTWENDKATN